jgi:membrane associated rhomboid family serine protease
VLFLGAAFVTGYYILNLSASIVGASAAIMGILVAVTTYQP